MTSIDTAFVVNAFGQLAFAGLETMPEPPAPKKKSKNVSRSRSDRRSLVRQLRAGAGGAASHVVGN